MEDTYQMFNLKDLHCYGCAHSAGIHEYPGRPSGERPCHFCVRNKEVQKEEDTTVNCWYDGSEPVSIPMDCYHSIDMKNQFEKLESDKANVNFIKTN